MVLWYIRKPHKYHKQLRIESVQEKWRNTKHHQKVSEIFAGSSAKEKSRHVAIVSESEMHSGFHCSNVEDDADLIGTECNCIRNSPDVQANREF